MLACSFLILQTLSSQMMVEAFGDVYPVYKSDIIAVSKICDCLMCNS